MSGTAVITRPERTSAEIWADRKAGVAFFARLDREWNVNQKRDLIRLMERESFDWKLRCCAFENYEWTARNLETSADRARRKYERESTNPLARRDNSKLGFYVVPETSALLPGAALHRRTVQERETDEAADYTYWRRSVGLAKKRAKIEIDDRTPFAQWLLLRPDYGPIRDRIDAAPDTGFIPSYNRYRKGQIRPVNITYERALAIAIAVLDKG